MQTSILEPGRGLNSFAPEPDCSEYSEQLFTDKLLEMAGIDSFTDYLG